jgi:hypothetical protein
LVLMAAGVLIAGAGPVQDEQSASFHQEMLTNATAPLILDLSAAPKFTLGPNTQLTGLFVDLAMPQQTWTMLDRSVPSQNSQEPVPPSRLPVMPPQPLSNPAVHEANFALVRLSFP